MKIGLMVLLGLVLVDGSPASRPADQAYRHVYVVYGRLEAKPIRESSGLVASRRSPGVYWTHNDSGNPPQLFAVDEFGKLLGDWWVDGATNYDWEDITLDGAGHLVVADTGDSRPSRVPQRLLVIDEPSDPRGGGHLRVRREIPFRLPEKSHDCEALFCEGGTFFVIDKRGSISRRTNKQATLYRITESKQVGVLASAEPIEQFPFEGSVTGAALSADGTRLAVLTYFDVFVFCRKPGGRFFTDHPYRINAVCGQDEGIAFHHDAPRDLLITCEQRMIFRLTPHWYESGRPFGPMARLPSSRPTEQGE